MTDHQFLNIMLSGLSGMCKDPANSTSSTSSIPSSTEYLDAIISHPLHKKAVEALKVGDPCLYLYNNKFSFAFLTPVKNNKDKPSYIRLSLVDSKDEVRADNRDSQNSQDHQSRQSGSNNAGRDPDDQNEDDDGQDDDDGNDDDNGNDDNSGNITKTVKAIKNTDGEIEVDRFKSIFCYHPEIKSQSRGFLKEQLWTSDFLERIQKFKLFQIQVRKPTILSKLFDAQDSSKSLADITIKCNDGEVKAHKCILWAACDFFQKLLETSMTESKTNVISFNARQLIVSGVLEYFYKDFINFSVKRCGGSTGPIGSTTSNSPGSNSHSSLDDHEMVRTSQKDQADCQDQKEVSNDNNQFVGWSLDDMHELIIFAHYLDLKEIIMHTISAIVLHPVETAIQYKSLVKIGQFLNTQKVVFFKEFEKINDRVKDCLKTKIHLLYE